MLVAPSLVHVGQESPADRVRYSNRYTSGISPLTLRFVFANADWGYLGPLMELEQELFKDELVIGMVTSRLSALSHRNFLFVPNRSDPDTVRAAEVADFANEVLQGLSCMETTGVGADRREAKTGGLTEIVGALARSFYYGLGLHWITWETKPGMPRPVPTGIEPLDERRYRLNIGTKELFLEVADGGIYGQNVNEYDPWKLMLIKGSSVVPRLEHAGVGRAMAFIYYLRYSSKLNMLKYSEKFAIPPVVGTFTGDPEQIKGGFTQDQRAQLNFFIQAYMNDVAGLFPPNFSLSFPMPPRGGETLFKFFDEVTRSAMAIACLGQDGTSDGGGGSLAKAQVNYQVLWDLVFQDMRRVGNFLCRLIYFAVVLEYGVETPPPEEQWEQTPEERQSQEIAKLEAATKFGIPVSVEYALSALGLPMPEDGAQLLDGSTWDGKAKKRIPAPLSRKEEAELFRTYMYPTTSGLAAGLAIDGTSIAKTANIPLEAGKPPYTPPLAPGQTAPAGEDASPQEAPTEEVPT